jgi:hypothetical protein
MGASVRDRLADVHPRMLRVKGEVDPQELGRRDIGRAIDAALDRARLTKQEAAYAMGYSDSAVMGRWIAGTETPQFAKLWTIGERFRAELVIALAEQVAGVDVVTEIRVRRVS